MPVLKPIQKFAVVLATLGIVSPSPLIQAAESTRAVKQSKVSSMIPDVKFTADGTLKGRVINHSGDSEKDAMVVVRQGNKEIARVQADESGTFAVDQLKPGIYQVSSGTTVGTFRVWNEKAAPPVARNFALIVLGENGARGQYGVYDGMDPGFAGGPMFDPTIVLLSAGVIATTTLGVISLVEINRLQNKVDDLSNKSPSSP